MSNCPNCVKVLREKFEAEAWGRRLLDVIAQRNRQLAHLTLEPKIEQVRARFAKELKHYRVIRAQYKQRKRQELAAELKGARARLRHLQERIIRQTAFINLFGSSLFERAPEYPPTPEPIVEVTESGQGVPSISGVYFIWRNGVIIYVGQSIRLSQRTRLRTHDVIRQGDGLSWLPFEKAALNFAESFYIGVHRPACNFGGVYALNLADREIERARAK